MLTTSQFRNISVWLLCKNVRTKIWVASGSQQVLVNIVMNYILIYIQQDATLHSLIYLETALHVSGDTTTQTTVSTASGICHTVIDICHYRGGVGTGLNVLWAVYATQLPIFQCYNGYSSPLEITKLLIMYTSQFPRQHSSSVSVTLYTFVQILTL